MVGNRAPVRTSPVVIRLRTTRLLLKPRSLLPGGRMTRVAPRDVLLVLAACGAPDAVDPNADAQIEA